MRTIILPGYSLHNKYWAYDVKSKLESAGFEAEVYEWKHWQGGRMNLPDEVKNICKIIGDEKVNFIAKSIGTKVLMKIFSKVGKQINKVILCGIPIDPVTYMGGIKKIGGKKLLIFQNSKDPFMPYKAISVYVKLIDKNIKVVEKEANTHEYPYYDEFINFLK